MRLFKDFLNEAKAIYLFATSPMQTRKNRERELREFFDKLGKFQGFKETEELEREFDLIFTNGTIHINFPWASIDFLLNK